MTQRPLCRLLLACAVNSLVLFHLCRGNTNAKRLFDDLFVNREYNKFVRPVANNSNALVVHMGLVLSQIIDIDERNQVMVTNLWLRKAWRDPRLQWNPSEYGGIRRIRVPSETIWLPDLVMFNNADGNYEVTLMTRATLFSSGKVLWEPPAIFKSSCQIDVEFFPFDKQRCSMKLGSWTYHGEQVDLRHILQTNATDTIFEYGIDLESFVESTEWDLLEVPARRNEKFHPCCPEPYPDITFSVVLRRKTLFYLINLIIPCVAISLLTLLVFYLPSECGEKTTLCISVLVALTLFFLLLVETIPATSLVVPLIGKYLLFTMVLVTLSIVVTVFVLNINFRSPSTHRLGPRYRKIFLDVLPRLMRMNLPESEPQLQKPSSSSRPSGRSSRQGAASWTNDWTNDSLAASRHADSRSSTTHDSDDRVFESRRRAGHRRAVARDLESLLSCEELDPAVNHLSSPYQYEQETNWQEQPTWQLRQDNPHDPANHPKVRRCIRGALDGVQYIADQLRDNSKTETTSSFTCLVDLVQPSAPCQTVRELGCTWAVIFICLTLRSTTGWLSPS